MIKTKISHITQRQRDQYVLSRRRCSTCDQGKVNVISSCDLDWCRFKQTVCVDLCAPFAHVGSITERYMGVIGVMNTWFKWKILYNKSVLRVVCA